MERAVRAVRVDRKLFVSICELKIREKRQWPNQRVLIPGPTAKSIVVPFDVFTLKFDELIEKWRKIGVHGSLTKFPEVGILRQWNSRRPIEKASAVIASEIKPHAIRRRE